MSIKYKEVHYFLVGFVIPLTFVVSWICFYEKPLIRYESFQFRRSFLHNFRYLQEKMFYNESLSNQLSAKVKILCMVMTHPANYKKKAIHVKNTWGRKCTKLLFIGSQINEELDIVQHPFEEKRCNLPNKSRWAFQYLHSHYLDEFDWFMKADDDSYVIVENLRYLLAQYNPKTSLLLGHRYAVRGLEEGYMAGGGYVLSKKALKKLNERIISNSKACRRGGQAEDWNIGGCLEHCAILVDCRDETRAKRFFPLGAEKHMKPLTNPGFWYTERQYYHSPEASTKCCSDTSVQFHYIRPTEMLAFEYYIYHVHPFGLNDHSDEDLPEKKSLKEIILASDQKSFSKNFKPHKDYHQLESSEIY